MSSSGDANPSLQDLLNLYQLSLYGALSNMCCFKALSTEHCKLECCLRPLARSRRVKHASRSPSAQLRPAAFVTCPPFHPFSAHLDPLLRPPTSHHIRTNETMSLHRRVDLHRSPLVGVKPSHGAASMSSTNPLEFGLRSYQITRMYSRNRLAQQGRPLSDFFVVCDLLIDRFCLVQV